MGTPVILERIEIAGPDRRARRLVFSGHETPRTTSAAVVKALSLEEGSAIEVEDLKRELDDLEDVAARERALRFLGYRERSVSELARRLADDGYPSRVCRAVVQRMEELHLVDDERFASAWARSRVASGLGPRRIQRELETKGIDAELANAAIAAAVGGEDPASRARATLRPGDFSDRAARDRAVRRLVRRGFDLSTAIKAVAPDAEGDEDQP